MARSLHVQVDPPGEPEVIGKRRLGECRQQPTDFEGVQPCFAFQRDPEWIYENAPWALQGSNLRPPPCRSARVRGGASRVVVRIPADAGAFVAERLQRSDAPLAFNPLGRTVSA